jgi:hypothetical protein
MIFKSVHDRDICAVKNSPLTRAYRCFLNKFLLLLLLLLMKNERRENDSNRSNERAKERVTAYTLSYSDWVF